MASLYIRSRRLWARYKDGTDAWCSAKTPFFVGDEEKAQGWVRLLERRLKAAASAGVALGVAPGQPVTVRAYGDKWLKDRATLGLNSAPDDTSRLRLHVFPVLGTLRLDEVRPRHVRDLVLGMRQAGKLAPRSIRHVYATLATMFRTALADELVDSTPCILARGILPKKVDKDPAWRAQAIYTREEVERLISDSQIPEDRRVLYALKGVAGLRHGEAAGLRWRHYDTSLAPLGGLSLEKTKTDVPRRVPGGVEAGRLGAHLWPDADP